MKIFEVRKVEECELGGKVDLGYCFEVVWVWIEVWGGRLEVFLRFVLFKNWKKFEEIICR